MAFILTNDENRIIRASDNELFHVGEGEIQVEIPETVDFENICDYRYIDGEYVYDPLPRPEPIVEEPTAEDMMNAMLRGLGYEQ